MRKKLELLKNRIRENFRENRIAVIAMFLLWFFVIGYTLYACQDSLGMLSSGNEACDIVIELSKGVVIKETVPISEDSGTIAVKFATFARNNSGTFDVTVKGASSNHVYAKETVKVTGIQDNAFATFRLDEKLDPEKDKQIIVELSSDVDEGQGIGVYYSSYKAFEDSRLLINEEEQEGDLSLRFLNDSEELSLFYHIIIVWVIVTFTFVLFLLLLVKPKYEILFTVIAIAFGLTFWLIITPMSVPDETVHYEYSFQLSNYIMGEENHLLFDEEYQNYGAMAGHLNISAAYERFIKKINKPMNLRNNMVEMKYDIDESYTWCFIPQALGITVARLLNWNMLRTFYLGRLFNLTFYVFCVYIAIRKTPVHKLLFGILATLPIFMQQAASFSYDCYINGLTFVIISCLMKWMYQKEEISYWEFFFVFFANMLIAPIKVVYGLFTFLYWFVPAKKFYTKKNKILSTLVITAPAMYELVVLLAPLTFRIIRKIFENLFPALVSAETIYDPLPASFHVDGETYTFSYVMNHPLEAIELLLRTVRYSLKTWFYASFGRALSGNTLIIPTYLVHSLLALLVLSAIRQESDSAPILFKVAVLGICIFAGLMMVGGMLISWTEIDQEVIEDYGGPIIQGIQGRYFSPLLPYLFTILNNRKFGLSQKFDPYLIYAFVVIVFEVVVYVLSYTFVN